MVKQMRQRICGRSEVMAVLRCSVLVSVFVVWGNVFTTGVLVGATSLGPQFDYSTEHVIRVTAGSTAYLRCRVENLGLNFVSWIREKEFSILTVDKYTFTHDDRFVATHLPNSTEWILQILNTQGDDSGNYECQVSTYPPIRRIFNLEIRLPTAIITEGSEINVQSGTNVTLTCVVVGVIYPPEFISWYKHGEIISSDTSPHINVEKDDETSASNLIIYDAQTQDSGVYSCMKLTSVKVFVRDLQGPENYAYNGFGNLTDGSEEGSFAVRLSSSWCVAVLSQVLVTLTAILSYA